MRRDRGTQDRHSALCPVIVSSDCVQFSVLCVVEVIVVFVFLFLCATHPPEMSIFASHRPFGSPRFHGRFSRWSLSVVRSFVLPFPSVIPSFSRSFSHRKFNRTAKCIQRCTNMPRQAYFLLTVLLLAKCIRTPGVVDRHPIVSPHKTGNKTCKTL